MALYSFEGNSPQISEKAYVHDSAQIIGNVVIGENCFVGAGAIIRGDYGELLIGEGTAVEEGAIIHCPPLCTCKIGKSVTIGHGAILHCADIGDGAVIGMGAIVSIGAKIGVWAIVAEGAVVTMGQEIPTHKIAAGNPAKIIGDVTDGHKEMWSWGKDIYVDLSQRYPGGLKKL